MHRPRFKLPSPAIVIASIALFMSLGATSYAAKDTIMSALGKNTVGTAQLKNDAVTGPKIKSKTVTTNDLKDKSITKAKLAAGVAISGPQGPAGPAGPAGQNGANGINGQDGTNGQNGTDGANGATKLKVATSQQLGLGAGHHEDDVFCPQGSFAVSAGGFAVTNPGGAPADIPMVTSLPLDINGNILHNNDEDPVGWLVGFNNNSGGNVNIDSYVLCASP